LPLGALRLTEQFGEGKLKELCEHARAILRPALKRYKIGNGRMIGTGGTISTFARMEWGAVDHVAISQEALRESVQRLDAMTLTERRKVASLPPDRADIIVAGGAVFLVAMELLEADELTVSVRNLRYGALLAG
jgi:exopolyphosphatase/guanosine-5'-triphosphate,3'-diphosphate pyrophosphatase